MTQNGNHSLMFRETVWDLNLQKSVTFLPAFQNTTLQRWIFRYRFFGRNTGMWDQIIIFARGVNAAIVIGIGDICDPSLTQEDWLKRQHFPFCLRCSWKTQLRNFNPHKGEESKKNRTKKLVLIWPLFPWSGDGKRRKGCIGDLLTKDSPSMAIHKEQSSCLFPIFLVRERKQHVLLDMGGSYMATAQFTILIYFV